MKELNPAFEGLAKGMLEEKIVMFGDFELSSGKKSAAYVQLREMISVPHLFVKATDAYAETIIASGVGYNSYEGKARHLSAIAEAANYYGGSVAYATGLPLIQRRVKTKKHGQSRVVEGRYDEGDEVTLLDDVITTAGSKKEEAAALRAVGLIPKAVVVLVDREQGGRTELESQGLEFASAMTLSSIVKYALDERLARVTQTMYDEFLGELDPNELART